MRRWSSRAILLAGWIVFLLYAYPGYIPPASADELVDARVGVFTDWHSPTMTELWRIIERVVAGPAGMLLVQSGLLLVGAYTLLRRAMSERRAAQVAVGLLLFPPILATVAVVSYEVLFATLTLAGIATLTSDSVRLRVIGLGLLVVACAVAPATELAVFVLVVGLFQWRTDHVGLRRLAIAAGAGACVVVAAFGVDAILVDVRTQRVEVTRAMSDIVGTLNYASTLDDAKVQALLADVPLTATNLQDRARALYHKSASRFVDQDEGLFVPPETAERRASLLAARRALALAEPVAYVKHRAKQLYRVLGFSPSSRWSGAYTKFVPAKDTAAVLQHQARHSLLQNQLVRGVRAISGTFLFKPFVYAAIALLLLPLALWRRQRLAAVLLGSAIGYELALMFVATRVEYRDSHWLVVSTVLAVILMIAASAGTAIRAPRPRDI